ncbi:hypothetical protein BH23BAC3_BH23BAC3_17140 [soil metagenome]
MNAEAFKYIYTNELQTSINLIKLCLQELQKLYGRET